MSLSRKATALAAAVLLCARAAAAQGAPGTGEPVGEPEPVVEMPPAAGPAPGPAAAQEPAAPAENAVVPASAPAEPTSGAIPAMAPPALERPPERVEPPPRADAPTAPSAATQEKRPKSPWRGSQIIYEHTGGVLGLSRAAEPTWNPWYQHVLSIRPRYHFGRGLFAGLRWDVGQELTNGDDTTYYREVVSNDVVLSVGRDAWKERVTGLALGGDVQLVLPTSKVARAQTLHAGVFPGATATRGFDLLEGLDLQAIARWGLLFHRYTTVQYRAPALPCGADLESPDCGRFLQPGTRNVRDRLTLGLVAALRPVQRLELSATFLVYRSGLYRLPPTERTGDGADDVDVRYANLYQLDASYEVLDDLTVSVGVSTLNPQLRPDSTYYAPFFNRYTGLYLDLAVNLDAVRARFAG